ncbi:hypothetical protein KJ855_02095 [Patescibacteria group bacterium]|nr:hypothetical protein [Patescibacteria group bacterium]
MLSNSSTKVEERVKVVVSFGEKTTPLLLVWNGRRIYVKQMNLQFEKKVGDSLLYYFHVSDTDDNGYKLCFDTEKLSWMLDEVTF